MERADTAPSRLLTSMHQRGEHPPATDELGQMPPSPTSSTGTPVFVNATPRDDSPPSSSMGDSWVALTPNSDDEQVSPERVLRNLMMNTDLALAVEGLRIHEHEESFPSEGEDDDDEDISIPLSEDSSAEEDGNDESSDEETILAPRTLGSVQPVSDEALRASLTSLLRSKETNTSSANDRRPVQGPLGMESITLVNPEEFATRASITTSRASSAKSHSRGRKSHSKRSPRSPSKVRNKEAQIYALWTAAITAGFLVGFGAGYAWKEYLAGGSSSEDVRRVGCAWCGEGKR